MAVLPLFAGAQYLPYTAGHMDIGVRLEAGNLVGYWKNDFATVNGSTSSQPEYDANGLVAVGIFDDATPPLTRPAGSQWDFLGVAAGEPIYILPSSGVPNTLPYLGLSTENPSIAFLDEITFTLAGFSGPAGSTFNLFTSSSSIFMTGTNATVTGSATLENGDHQHYNWAFSHQGIYELTLSFADDTNTYFGSDTFRFAIVPEPSTTALVVLASLLPLLYFRQRRRAAS